MGDLTLSQEDAKNLHSVIYRTMERLGADYQVLALFGSLFDTMEVSEIVGLAEDWLSTGETVRTVTFQ